LSLLGLTACLDEHPKSQLAEEDVYNSATNLYINTVATLYNYVGGSSDSEGLQGTYRGVYDYNTFTTDEAMLPTRGGDWYDGGFWQNLYLHQWTSTDLPLYDTWNYLYKVVTLCNRSLSLINQYSSLLTEDEEEAYTAEVRAIRALFYFYLLDMYGRVPLVVSSDVALSDVQQSERSDVFRFVIDELQEVAPLLPDEMSQYEGDYYGRVTRPVAYFLLAKLMLNTEVYDDDDWTDGQRPDGGNIYFTVDGETLNAWQATLAYCDKVGEAGYRLESDYADNFIVNNENSAENIFTIPMDKTLYLQIFKNLFRSRHYNHGSAIGMDAENGTCATISTVETYGYGTAEVDKRYAINFYSDTLYVDGEVVCLDNGKPLVYMPLAVELDLTGSTYEKTAGARMSKYEIDRTAYSDGQLQNNDIVLFRYADVLLMMAEAKVRNGEDGSTELNLIRARAGMGSREATLPNLLDERLLELMWEGWRRQDLIRFGCFTSAYDARPQLSGESNGYTTVFPIPSKAMDLNENLSQNPGYN
ncbi:MAG: RagB/SusD family nutrient uptake outer membrane protein, partial [Bacteroides sp.]|nr:RagB/SusD family nutrient uptake outer membrane protein [Bacteroides sp.]